MVNFKPFKVEEWMDKYENTPNVCNVAETCAASISLADLQGLSESKDTFAVSMSKKMTYGHIRGSPELRSNLASLYSSRASSPLSPDDIVITSGAISANYLTLYSLISPGDHVICHYPTYQQLYSVPESLGANVTLWRSDSSKSWLPSLDDLKASINPQTKLVILNNPQNPTGAILGKTLLESIVEVAREKNITILADEVYRPIFHGITPIDSEFPPSLLSMKYNNVIVTGSLSKAYSLAGIRVGWLASRNPDLIERIASARHYTTISVSQIDDSIATFALSRDVIHSLLSKNITLAKTNLEILERFIIKHDEYCSWVKPVAGTTAFVKFSREGKAVDDVELCRRLIEEAGVMFVPGSYAFGEEFEGYVRVGYVCETEVLKEGLEKVRKWMRKEFDDMPLAE